MAGRHTSRQAQLETAAGLASLLSFAILTADLAPAAAAEADAAWRLIAPHFQPPPEFAGKFGEYRSPLRFGDGAPVRSASDWPRRREEILRTWLDLMGPWPPVLERPKLETLREEKRDGSTWRRVRLEIAPQQAGEGWLLIPEGKGPFPAVLVVYYEPETSVGLKPDQPLRDFGLQLARRGFVTLSIGTPGGDARKPELGAAVCQPLSFHAYVAANCWHALANLPQVDRARIGVTGHSYGGKWAMFAAALWEKFAAVAVSDPGIVFDESRPNVNYWEPWYLGLDPQAKRPKAGVPTADNPRTGAYKKMIEQGRDLHEIHALIAPRPFLVSGGSEDPPSRWLPLNHLVGIDRLLGFTNRVAMTNRKAHPPDEDSNAQLYAFFEHFLKAAAQPRPRAEGASSPVGTSSQSRVRFNTAFEDASLGKVRLNAYGYDVNRHWHEVDLHDQQWLQRCPEIGYAKKAIFAQRDSPNPIDLLLNLHNDEEPEYLETQIDSEAGRALVTRLLERLVATTSFDASRPPSFNAAPTSTSNDLRRQRRVPIVLMEQRIAPSKKLACQPTPEARLNFGRQLSTVMAETVLQ
jgi:dienelactone hydrolase